MRQRNLSLFWSGDRVVRMLPGLRRQGMASYGTDLGRAPFNARLTRDVEELVPFFLRRDVRSRSL